jgi:lipid-A-disaccharide synthase
LDRLAVILPFEAPLWTNLGASARYVGHPALSATPPWLLSELEPPRAALHIAVLPGSRPAELRRHLPMALRAVETLRCRGIALGADVRLCGDTALADERWARTLGAEHAVPVLSARSRVPAVRPTLALAASGTVTVEAALANIPPVIFYKMDRASAWLAGQLIRVERIGLPNIVLDRDAFPECIQEHATPSTLAEAVLTVLEQLDLHRAHCAELRARFEAGLDSGTTPAERVADWLDPWLD